MGIKSRAAAPGVSVVYRLVGIPLRHEETDLPPRLINLSHIPLHELQRIFHAGPGNRLLEHRVVNEEKASRLQSFCAETIDPSLYRWEFSGRWSDEDRDTTPVF